MAFISFAAILKFEFEHINENNWCALDIPYTALKGHSSAFLISRYILRLGQGGRCCFCAACPNRKMYLEIRNADERALKLFSNF